MTKKIMFFMMLISVLSCKTNSLTSTKIDNKSEKGIKGEWSITSVEYPGKEYFKVNSFSIADSQCFVGSTWKFIYNNNSGDMALTQSKCTNFESKFTWFINKEGQFVLKLLNAGDKAKKVRDGYVMEIKNQTETSFQLVDKIQVGTKPTDIVYQFQKN